MRKLLNFGLIILIFILTLNIISAVEPDYTKYYMFVTNGTYTGAGNDPNGIDAICNKDVPIFGTERPTNGTYKAYISRDGNYPGEALGMDVTRAIYRPDGTIIANNYLNLESGNWLNTIFRENYVGMVLVWTGIIPSGESQSRDCSDWTTQNEGGYYGLVGFGAINDKNTWAKSNYNVCSTKNKIYCIGPFKEEVVNYCGDRQCFGNENSTNCELDCADYNTPGRYYMFVTQATYNGSLGGIEGADIKCNTDIKKPGEGVYRTFLSATENYIVPKGMKTTFPIYSTETLKKIANDFYDLTDGSIENPIAPLLGGTRIWTHSYSGGACNSWTNSEYNQNKMAWYGQPNTIFDSWWQSGPSHCSEKYSLYCIGPLEGEEIFYCGDGIIQANNSEGINEICDDGINNGKYGYCKADCSGKGSYCGDGVCNSSLAETCSGCSQDCGACPIVTPPAGGGGGGSSSSSTAGGGGGGSVSASGTTYTLSIEETTKPEGITKEIGIYDKIKFYILNNQTEEEHSITISDLSSTSVRLTIQSNIIVEYILINETKKFDLTNDSFYDLKIKLNSIQNDKASLTINIIHEEKPKITEKKQESNIFKITGNIIGFVKTDKGKVIISGVLILVIIWIFLRIKNRKLKKNKRLKKAKSSR